jgi:hypothetical protein
VPLFIVRLAPLLPPTRISRPPAIVGELMMGPVVSVAISTLRLVVGRPSGFQFEAVDHRLSPAPLSQDTPKTLAVKNKTANTNTGTVLRIESLNDYNFVKADISTTTTEPYHYNLLPPLYFERHFSPFSLH